MKFGLILKLVLTFQQQDLISFYMLGTVLGIDGTMASKDNYSSYPHKP